MTVNTQKLLATIHKAEAINARQKSPELTRLINSALGILTFHLRKPIAKVTSEQALVITLLQQACEQE